MVNGEVAGVDDFYVRIDNPIVHIEVDEATHELCMLHQTQEELDKILKEIEQNGDSKGIQPVRS